MKKEDKYYNNNIYMRNKELKRFSSFLTIICTIFAIIVVGLIGFTIYTLYDNYCADKEAEKLMDQFENIYVDTETPNIENEIIYENIANEVIYENITENTNTTTNTTPNTSKPSTKPSYGIGTYYKKYKVIGTISIPKLNIQYPIFDVDNTETLRVGTAAIYPKDPEYVLNKQGNVVIAGHNYRSSRMFSKLNTLKNGDSIYITNILGTKLEYKVYNNYTADVNDFGYATRDTNDSIEISLTTCTNNAQTRTVIWAKVE